MDEVGITSHIESLMRTFAAGRWNLNLVVGSILMLAGFAVFASLKLFGEMLTLQWLGKEASGKGPSEPAAIKVKKFIAPLLTKNPNDEFRPYIYYWVPLAASGAAMMLVGFFILAVKSSYSIPAGLLLLGLALYGCLKLAQWQVRNRRW